MRFLHINLGKSTLLWGLLAIVMACQTNPFTFEGATVREGISVPLKDGGPHSGKWSYKDEVFINFTYTKGPSTLQISGDVDMRYGSPRLNYAEYFWLRLHFVDGDSKIIGSKIMVSAGHKQEVETFTFNETTEVPSGTIAFSYDGHFVGNSDDGGWTFWMDPRRSNTYGVFY